MHRRRGTARLGPNLAGLLVVLSPAALRGRGRFRKRHGTSRLLQERVQLGAQHEYEAQQIQIEREQQEHAEQRVRMVGREQRHVERKQLRDHQQQH